MPCEKIMYGSAVEAEKGRGKLEADAKRTGSIGKSWKRLNSYKCRWCSGWHIGRANSLPARKTVPTPAIPSTGQLRRKLKRITQKLDCERKHRAYQLGKLIEADLAAIRTENELAETQRQVAGMFLG
jgi:hypothetical protein